MSDGFYVRVDDRTPEQEALCSQTYEVAKQLRAQGIACEVREFMCFGPKDCPAVIELKGA